MSDLIDRQDAIDAMCNLMNSWFGGDPKDEREEIKWIINHLPSSQPEIIYCGDCKYKDDGIDEDGIPFLKCLHGRSYGDTRINDFCSWSERRTDERHDQQTGCD